MHRIDGSQDLVAAGQRQRAQPLPAATGRGRNPDPHARRVSHHYDVGNHFYTLVLGPSMVYSCAYFEQPLSAAYTLEDAQRAKLDLVTRKLGLAQGMRLLDVGCGWGSLVIHAFREVSVPSPKSEELFSSLMGADRGQGS